MKINSLDYSELKDFFSPLVLNYLCEKPSLRGFYAEKPDRKGFENLIKNRANVDRKLLVEGLEKQYQVCNIPDVEMSASYENIELLKQDNTFTVTTGHQLNLATGPLYFVFKIISTIKLARRLKEYFPDYNFVPVYWMATEDHDFEEINHVHLFGKRIEWTSSEVGGAVGEMATDTLKDFVEEMEALLGADKDLVKQLNKAYLSNRSLAQATRYFVHALFGKYGLVVVDANQKEFKARFSTIMQQDILSGDSANLIADASQILRDLGYKTQAKERDVNFFYLQKGARKRIERELNLFKVLGSDIVFGQEELKKMLRESPEDFSPNVLLRPLYQEVLLPNLAYIGGGAEVSYWLQIKKVFEHYNVDYPIVMLRNSALLVDSVSSKRWAKLNFGIQDYFLPTDTLVKKWVSNNEKPVDISSSLKEIELVFEQLKQQVLGVDATLGAAADSAKVKSLAMLKDLEAKVFKAHKNKFEEQIQQISKTKDKVFPGGVLNERVNNALPYLVQLRDEFIDVLLHNFDPIDNKFLIVEL